MTVQELIDVLKTQNPNLPVFLEYDSMCCVFDNFGVVKIEKDKTSDKDENDLSGIYLMCEDRYEIEFYLGFKDQEWHGKLEHDDTFDGYNKEILYSKEDDE